MKQKLTKGRESRNSLKIVLNIFNPSLNVFNFENESAGRSESCRESWRLNPLRGLLHVKNTPLLAGVT